MLKKSEHKKFSKRCWLEILHITGENPTENGEMERVDSYEITRVYHSKPNLPRERMELVELVEVAYDKHFDIYSWLPNYVDKGYWDVEHILCCTGAALDIENNLIYSCIYDTTGKEITKVVPCRILSGLNTNPIDVDFVNQDLNASTFVLYHVFRGLHVKENRWNNELWYVEHIDEEV